MADAAHNAVESARHALAVMGGEVWIAGARGHHVYRPGDIVVTWYGGRPRRVLVTRIDVLGCLYGVPQADEELL